MKTNSLFGAVAISLLASAAVLVQAAETGKTPTQQQEVEFTSGQIRLAATLLLPPSAAKVPGVVIIHGSGDSDRSNPWTRAYAEALAKRGIAVLHPDKRGSGKSGGDWKTAGISDFADDAMAAVDFLQGYPGLDPARVGLIGFSQGGHVLPVAASRSARVAFAIAVSSSAIPMAEQIADEVEMGAERASLTSDQIKLVTEINRLGLRFVADGTEENWQVYESLLTKAKADELKGSAMLERFPARRDHPALGHLRRILPSDPLPYWKQTTVPMLFVFGGKDTQIRVRKSLDRLQAELPADKFNYSVLFFSQNGHALFREDLNDLLAKWIIEKGKP